ncbi:MAG: putative lipid II flippase FtsW [Proteobacteria bacterium]|nr:putative lipid II flippase FtsW [Pseudomonadota bacterium]
MPLDAALSLPALKASTIQSDADPVLAVPAPAAARGLDLVLLACTLALLALGLVMVASASAVFAKARYHDMSHFLSRQLAFAAVGLLALWAGWRIDYRTYRGWVYPALLATFALLVGLLVPGLGTHVDGATRWFRLGGVSFQPSELAKLSLILYLAHSLAAKQEQIRSFSVGFLPHLLVAGLLAGLVLKQPDLGTAALLLGVALLLLFVSGARVSYLLIAVLSAAPVAYQQIVGTPWRLRRMIAFIDPWAFRSNVGYQISESLISVGSGGIFGLGLGSGKQKLLFLPAAHTDFIFAITGEELGLVGLGAVVLLFALLVVRGMRAALGAHDLFGTYLAFGLSATIGLQAVLHMTVVLGMVPTKGIGLPFYSYGGSALVVQLFAIGVLLNIAARHPPPSAPALRWRDRWDTRGNRRRLPRVIIARGRPGVDADTGC